MNSLAEVPGHGDNDKEPVFVYVVNFLDGGENCIARRWSFARLYGANEFLCSSANIAYSSPVTGFTEFFCRGVNGEIVPFLNHVAVLGDQGGKKVVEAGCEMMNNLAGKNGKAVGNRFMALRQKDILSCVVLEFLEYCVRWRVGAKESVDLHVEILDAFVGPLNLRPTATQ